jgi:hypothetical protein
MNELVQLLRQLEQARYYGALEIKFEAGNIVLIKKTETIRPTQPSYGTSRGESDVTRQR